MISIEGGMKIRLWFVTILWSLRRREGDGMSLRRVSVTSDLKFVDNSGQYFACFGRKQSPGCNP